MISKNETGCGIKAIIHASGACDSGSIPDSPTTNLFMIDFKKKMEELEKKEAKENGHNEILLVDELQPKKRKISNFLIAIIVIAIIFSGKVIMSSQSTADWLAEKGFFNKLKHLVISGDKQIKGEANDRINILLLEWEVKDMKDLI